ncbi:hypothetical protein HanPSC8_Chr17g0774321 [Helianthus annuus]|nr:hypothetical protein HanIR_Chr17g0875321 [Helianthus annuus]KAJ0813519.1 hypothetical protein HanPSC8_Chr17g0774321 [Helianthus annuus]
MDAETLKRLNVYQGVEKDKEPPYRKQFGSVAKPNYVAPDHDKWRHDDSNSDSEDKKMELFANKRGKFLLKAEDKKRKKDSTPKVSKSTTPKDAPKRLTKKKSPPHLVDKPVDVPPENVYVTGDDILQMTFDEYEKIATAQVALEAEKAKNDEQVGGENVEATTGGETVKEKLVEYVVHIDSSKIESDIDVTQLAPTTYVCGKIKIKGPSRKKKGSDEEDASYVPTPTEAEKLKKCRGMKRSAKPTGETPRKQKIRKTTSKAVKGKSGESVKALEKVIVEEPVVQAEIHVPIPPVYPIQVSIPVQAEVHVSTPEQPPKTVEEPGSTTKKILTPKQEGSSQSFPKVPSNLDAGPTSLDEVGYIPFFNDDKVDELAKKVAALEKAKAETDEKQKQVEAENVVLKNENLSMNERLLNVEAGNNALNEAIDELLVTNCD